MMDVVGLIHSKPVDVAVEVEVALVYFLAR